MKITVRQLRTLIREAVEDASGEQLYDPSLGLEVVTSSREAANGTIALLDPETNEKYNQIGIQFIQYNIDFVYDLD